MTNEAQATHWNSDAATRWIEDRERYDAMLGGFGARVLERAAPTGSEAVVDIGCGTGTLTRAAARLIPGGSVLGLDVSAPMIDHARSLASAEGVTNVEFRVTDVQTGILAPFDVGVSRFGVMFFDDPVAAFANLRASLRPSGRVVFVCWKAFADNDWMLVPGAAIASVAPPIVPSEPDAPGPFAFGDPDRIRDILARAGFVAVDVTAVDGPMLLGGPGGIDDAVRFATRTSLARRLLEHASTETVAAARDAVRTALEPHVTDSGVELSAAVWLVAAHPE